MRLEKYVRIVVFDSLIRRNFYPLSLTRPTFEFLSGTGTQLSNIEALLGAEVTDLMVPTYLEKISKERHPKKKVNEQSAETCLAINSLLKSDYPLLSELSKMSERVPNNFLAVDGEGNPVFGVIEGTRAETLLRGVRKPAGIRMIQTSHSLAPIFKHPWELVSANAEMIQIQSSRYMKDKGPVRSGGRFEVLGRKLRVSKSAELERYVTLDTTRGDIIVDEGAKIQSFSHIRGPVYIGKGSVIKSAKIREGTTIGNHSVVGGEMEQSIMFEYSNKSHDGFIGHSLIGSWINLGAMTTNSDLKNTYGIVKVRKIGSPEKVDTGMIKVGCFMGDMCKTAIGATIGSGRRIGVSSHVFGMVLDDVPSFSIYSKSYGSTSVEIYIQSAIETQRRMMERRDTKMSENYEKLIKSVFMMTTKERIAGAVRKGKFEF